MSIVKPDGIGVARLVSISPTIFSDWNYLVRNELKGRGIWRGAEVGCYIDNIYYFLIFFYYHSILGMVIILSAFLCNLSSLIWLVCERMRWAIGALWKISHQFSRLVMMSEPTLVNRVETVILYPLVCSWLDNTLKYFRERVEKTYWTMIVFVFVIYHWFGNHALISKKTCANIGLV